MRKGRGKHFELESCGYGDLPSYLYFGIRVVYTRKPTLRTFRCKIVSEIIRTAPGEKPRPVKATDVHEMHRAGLHQAASATFAAAQHNYPDSDGMPPVGRPRGTKKQRIDDSVALNWMRAKQDETGESNATKLARDAVAAEVVDLKASPESVIRRLARRFKAKPGSAEK